MRSRARSWSLSSATRSALPKPAMATARQPSVTWRSAMMAPSALTTTPVPYSTVLRAGGEWIERPRHRDHDRLHGAFGGLVVEYGEDTDLVALEGAAQVKLLQALQARQHEEIRLHDRVVDVAPGGVLF